LSDAAGAKAVTQSRKAHTATAVRAGEQVHFTDFLDQARQLLHIDQIWLSMTTTFEFSVGICVAGNEGGRA
jgi:hypothetical protein